MYLFFFFPVQETDSIVCGSIWTNSWKFVICITTRFFFVWLLVSFCRAATIITREDGCQFLRVDKDDFNRILRDVEANTVRLKEHGRDVLVLEKVSANPSAAHRHSASSHYKYK